jgi:hypothetical protein
VAIDVQCEKCNRQFRVPNALAGKRMKCPSCPAVVEIPAVSKQPVAAAAQPRAAGNGSGGSSKITAGSTEQWHLQGDGGQRYGPVSRQELDSWVADGRVDANCQLLRDGWEQWKWADEIYPELAPRPAAEPVESPPAANGSATDVLASDAPSPAPAPPAPVEELPVIETSGSGKNGAAGTSGSSKKSAADPLPQVAVESGSPHPHSPLEVAAQIYMALTWVVVGAGGLMAFLCLVGFMLAMISSESSSLTVIGLIMSEALIVLATVVGWITMKTIAALIRLAIKVGQDHSATAEACQKMVELLGKQE